ncbi:DUF1643 domain-containing protein [Devosia algicola]|uniref:DUF1643 domain-containing protein n=1 Tax=Devosia algicola TaxID=3026418 RepID=A0ABY7YQH3_9HYPH|nr:DUF1643 domain-containing protein [Devosia algicola]WDR03310.1 DUF1643 domain-containing protein [Devosia algicola]
MTEADHDPGGKVRLALPPNVHGDAQFSDAQHRQMMRRWLGDNFPQRYALFIGMNPSTADALVNDPTCAREWNFCLREGYQAMMKGNVGDYRATNPKDLLRPDVVASSPANLPTLLDAALHADLVVVCHGKLNRALVEPARQIVTALSASNISLWCFGINADGSPKHPLYLRLDTPLVRYTAC